MRRFAEGMLGWVIVAILLMTLATADLVFNGYGSEFTIWTLLFGP